jgi:hypothetical protein
MTEEQEDLPEFDYTDPLKRDEDGESMRPRSCDHDSTG